MFSQDDDALHGVVLTVVFCLVALVITLVLAQAIGRSRDTILQAQTLVGTKQDATSLTAIATASAVSGVVVTSPQDAVSAAQAVSDAGSVKVEYGVVKFYFASGKAYLAPGAVDALAGVVKGAGVDRKLVVSGFHDATGNAAQNAELARQRAWAVRNALRAAGVREQQIDVNNPTQTVDTHNNAEARRVEVALQ